MYYAYWWLWVISNTMNTSLISSKTNEWSTPQWLFDKLHERFQFTTDSCCTHANHKCEQYYYTLEDGLDGLKLCWFDNVFMNPPYGRGLLKWIEKAYDEVFYERDARIVVGLVPARTDTKWFQYFIFPYAQIICFIKGRLKFGDAKINAPFPSCLFVFSRGGLSNLDVFFQQFGYVVSG